MSLVTDIDIKNLKVFCPKEECKTLTKDTKGNSTWNHQRLTYANYNSWHETYSYICPVCSFEKKFVAKKSFSTIIGFMEVK